MASGGRLGNRPVLVFIHFRGAERHVRQDGILMSKQAGCQPAARCHLAPQVGTSCHCISSLNSRRLALYRPQSGPRGALLPCLALAHGRAAGLTRIRTATGSVGGAEARSLRAGDAERVSPAGRKTKQLRSAFLPGTRNEKMRPSHFRLRPFSPSPFSPILWRFRPRCQVAI